MPTATSEHAEQSPSKKSCCQERTSYDQLIQQTYSDAALSPRRQDEATCSQPQFDADCELVRRRIRSASYSEFGQDSTNLSIFRDAGGHTLRVADRLTCSEFVRVVRLEGKIPPKQISNRHLQLIFKKVLGATNMQDSSQDIEDNRADGALHDSDDPSVAIEVFSTWIWGGNHTTELVEAGERRAVASLGSTRRQAIRLDTPKMQQVRRMIQAASYVAGGSDYAALFRYADTDVIGEIDLFELHRALRVEAKVPCNLLSNCEIERLFATLDNEKRGFLLLSDLVAFATGCDARQVAKVEICSPRGNTSSLSAAKRRRPRRPLPRNSSRVAADVEPPEFLQEYDRGRIHDTHVSSFDSDLLHFDCPIRSASAFSPMHLSRLAEQDVVTESKSAHHQSPPSSPPRHPVCGPTSAAAPFVNDALSGRHTSECGRSGFDRTLAASMVGYGPMQTAGFLSKRSDKPWATLWRPTQIDLARDKRVQMVRRKLRAAGYCKGGVDGISLFRYYDRDNSGKIGFAEFRSACRRDGKMTPGELSDQDLASLFATLDVDNSGQLELVEFQNFLNTPNITGPDVAYGATWTCSQRSVIDSRTLDGVDQNAGNKERPPPSAEDRPSTDKKNAMTDVPPALFRRRLYAACHSE